MPKLVAKELTYLKRRDVQVGDLSPADYRKVPKGGAIAAAKVIPANGQSLILEISGDSKSFGLKNGDRWYAYAPHWAMVGIPITPSKPAAPKNIRLNAPYFAQNDSNTEGGRQCFSHAVAMAADFLTTGQLTRTARAKGYAQPENYYNDIRDRFGDTTINTAHIAALRELDIEAYFTQSVSPADLYRALELGVPVPIGVRWKVGGHWVCAVGIESGNWLVHDPNGARNGDRDVYFCRSTDQGREGAFDVYSPPVMDSIYWDGRRNDDRECGWAIVITSVNGKATGLPDNL